MFLNIAITFVGLFYICSRFFRRKHDIIQVYDTWPYYYNIALKFDRSFASYLRFYFIMPASADERSILIYTWNYEEGKPTQTNYIFLPSVAATANLYTDWLDKSVFKNI